MLRVFTLWCIPKQNCWLRKTACDNSAIELLSLYHLTIATVLPATQQINRQIIKRIIISAQWCLHAMLLLKFPKLFCRSEGWPPDGTTCSFCEVGVSWVNYYGYRVVRSQHASSHATKSTEAPSSWSMRNQHLRLYSRVTGSGVHWSIYSVMPAEIEWSDVGEMSQNYLQIDAH